MSDKHKKGNTNTLKSKQNISYPQQNSLGNEEQISFGCDLNLVYASVPAMLLLYMSVQQRYVSYFVFTSLMTILLYPIYRARKDPEIGWKRLLFQSTFLPSILYDIWTLVFVQNSLVSFVPQLLGIAGRIYHMLSSQNQQTVTQISIYQSKIQIFVLFYSIISALLTLCCSWTKIGEFIILCMILRYKYYVHGGTRQAYYQIHMFCDRISKYLNLRYEYHSFYVKITEQGQKDTNDHLSCF